MGKLIAGIGILILLIVVAALAAPFLIPVENYRGLIEAQVEKTTGHAFHIRGPMKLSLLPSVRIELNDVALDNAPGGQAPELASIQRLDVGVALLPLLDKRVKAEKLILIGPRIALEIDPAGKPNWQFPKQAESAPKTTTGPKGQSVTLHFEGLDLRDGHVSYTDRRKKTAYVAEKVNLSLGLSDIESPITAKGDLVYRGQRVDIAAKIQKPQALMEGGTTPFTAKINADPAHAAFDGSVAGGKVLQVTGDLTAAVPAVEKLQAWLAPAPAPGAAPPPVHAVSLTAHVTAGADRARLAGLVLKADTVEARGDLDLSLAGARPKLAGTLTTGVLDLSPYMPASGAKSSGDAAAPGRDAPSGWSTKPIDLSGLRQADADLQLKLAGLKGRNFTIGATSLTIALRNGTLDVALPSTALFGGTADGRLHADASGPAPSVGVELHVRDVQAEPLLTAFAGYDRLQGAIRGSAALRARGASQKAMMDTLSGTMNGGLFNGAIRGIDVQSLLGKAQSIALGRGPTSSAKTSFAELSASFAVRNGTAHTEDLKMVMPALRLAGKGDVLIARQQVDMRIEPEVLGGQKNIAVLGKASSLLSVPLIVSGPWTRPSVRPDLAAAAKGGLKEKLKDLGGGSGSGSGGSGAVDKLRGLFGR